MANYIGTTPVSSQITPRNTRDKYPTHSEEFALGGYRSVSTIQERDAIPANRRKEGMLVYIVQDDITYILKNSLWEEVLVELTVKSKDNTVTFNKINTLRVDTSTGLGFFESSTGEVTLSSQKSIETITAGTDTINLSQVPDVNLTETETILPSINGNTLEFKTKSFSYNSSAPSTSFSIVHNLGTKSLMVNIFEVKSSGELVHIVTSYSITDLNTVDVELTVARNIMVNIIPL